MKSNYIEKVNGFIVPYLAKNGYELIKTEFVTEDNNNYLRLYIDLTKEELAGREAKQKSEAETLLADTTVKRTAEAATGAEAKTPENTLSSTEAKTAEATLADTAAETTEESQADTEAGTDEETIIPGVSINDCVKVSRYLSKWLDKEDFIKEMYTMEVCSRGFLEDAATSEDKETV